MGTQHIGMPFSTQLLGSQFRAFFAARLMNTARARLYNYYFNNNPRAGCTCLDSVEHCPKDVMTFWTICADDEGLDTCNAIRTKLVRNFDVKYAALILASFS